VHQKLYSPCSQQKAFQRSMHVICGIVCTRSSWIVVLRLADHDAFSTWMDDTLLPRFSNMHKSCLSASTSRSQTAPS
jgi:hypothetical protein